MSSRDVPANDACIVRPALPEDASLLQVVLDASAERSDADLFGLKAAGLLELHQVFLAFVAGQPVGCVMSTTAMSLGLHNLIVVPDQRGRGYGSSLIQTAISANVEAQGPSIYWTAIDPRVEGAMTRFQRLGFRRVDDAGHDLVLMIRSNDEACADGARAAA